MAYLKNSNVQSMFSQLGTFGNNEYIPSDCCHEILMHIHDKLNNEDPNSRHFRQIIGFSQLVKKNLIPMLILVNDDNILEMVIKILANIMTPIECLLPVSQLSGEDIGCLTILKLNWLLSTSKNACANLKAIKRLTSIIKQKLQKLNNNCSQESCDSLNSFICECLRLIKNILHIPNDQYQNRILWMLFSEKFDEVLIDMIKNTNRRQWVVLIIELMALMFKNQHVDQMASLLSKMIDTMISDSSEDNESNTSLNPKNGTSSSQENSSESSYSDDNNTEHHFKMVPFKEKPSNINLKDKQSTSSLSVVGQSSKEKLVDNEAKEKSVFKEPASLCKINRETHVEQNQINKTRAKHKTKMVEQPKHMFKNKTLPIYPICNSKAKLRTKKTTRTNMTSKSTIPDMPNHFYISHFLQKFTIRFLRNGFNELVDEVYNLLASNSQSQKIDSSLYFWILTYFCRFCKLVRIDLKSVRRIVSFKLISFIIYEGLKILQKLMIAKSQKSHDIHLQVRHLHLVIMSIKEIVKVIDYYIQTLGQSLVYEELIREKNGDDSGESNSAEFITWAKDLKSIFAVLIRQYDSSIQVIDYLHDLIITNHLVLSLFDSLKDRLNLSDGIAEHIKKFAANDIMYNYGTVLLNYKTNKEFVNEAVLTMMHHINGEVENTTVLFQPIILKTFLDIVEEKNPLYDRWSDLIECVINRH